MKPTRPCVRYNLCVHSDSSSVRHSVFGGRSAVGTWKVWRTERLPMLRVSIMIRRGVWA